MIASVTEYRQLPVEQLKMDLSDILDQNRASEWLRVGGWGRRSSCNDGTAEKEEIV